MVTFVSLFTKIQQNLGPKRDYGHNSLADFGIYEPDSVVK